MSYLRQHPEALVSHGLGGPGHRGIGEAIRLTSDQVQHAWKLLGLPPLGDQRRTEVERREARRKIRHERYLRTKQATAERPRALAAGEPGAAKEINRAARRRWETRVLGGVLYRAAAIS